MGIKTRGIQQSINRLQSIIDDVQGRKTVKAVQSALLIGGSQAAIYTPIDTSMLINSQFREIRAVNGLITGKVGYSANYAAIVHDPDIKMRFKRETAKKEFLKKGFQDQEAQIDAAVRRAMSL